MRLVAAEIEAYPSPDVELSPSVIRILSGALDAIASRGVKRLSMSDIIDATDATQSKIHLAGYLKSNLPFTSLSSAAALRATNGRCWTPWSQRLAISTTYWGSR